MFDDINDWKLNMFKVLDRCISVNSQSTNMLTYYHFNLRLVIVI